MQTSVSRERKTELLPLTFILEEIRKKLEHIAGAEIEEARIAML